MWMENIKKLHKYCKTLKASKQLYASYAICQNTIYIPLLFYKLVSFALLCPSYG